MGKNKLNPNTAKVGDGATECLYTDCHAYTIIKKTAKTITLQRDKATLITKPEITPGGFAGHCTNNDELKYEYTKDPNGVTRIAYWSEKKQKYMIGCNAVIEGRHEYYDYNF